MINLHIMTNNKISLTGIKPTGTIHIGNYLGAIQPAIELASSIMRTILLPIIMH